MIVHRRPGARFIARLPRNARCVAMAEFKGRLYVATERRIYVLKGARLVPRVYGRDGRCSLKCFRCGRKA